MFHHVGHLTLVPEITAGQLDAITEALLGLPGQIPGLLGGEVAPDAGLSEGNATLRFHMRFDSEESWRAYGSHPAHVAVVTEHIVPVLVGKAFVQYDDAAVRSASV
ncbi:Dabb family protein [Nocardioides sp.]|uniref:Dabb family protein n=1 Tax=Nocardioides sp. TaxID=35761 RepID=UPI0026398523|nr:Dabb family protein [Nocardioides sp.]